MSGSRLGLVAAMEWRHTVRRPLFWIFLFILGLTIFGLGSGTVSISSGDSQVGGTKAWITSEFAITQISTFLSLLLYGFFVAVAFGMSVIQDEEHGIGPLLHATPLRPSEYLRGKFAGLFLAFGLIVVGQILLSILFNHVVPLPNADEIRGPLNLMNYVRPALFITLPAVFFLAATSFAIGVVSRRAILVFVLPVALLLICGFFLWDWAPSWLNPAINKLLMVVDPAGFRWLNETWLKVDRGVAFYNTSPVGYDLLFWVNRAWMIGVGILSLVLAERHFARSLAGEKGPSKGEQKAAAERVATRYAEAVTGLAPLGMRGGTPPFLEGLLAVARSELRELLSQPGLYLFIPIILLQVIGGSLVGVGAFDTPLLATPGTMAVRTFNTLTLLVTLLLLFYTVESMERERASGLEPIVRAAPIRPVALLLGKTAANALVAVAILIAVLIGAFIVTLVQGKVAFSVTPFLLVWGLFLLPTLILWTTFVIALHAIVRNRYLTYALALCALIFTLVRQFSGKMNWVGNWPMWSTLLWSDMGAFQIDRTAIILNRVMAIGLAALFIALTLRFYGRREGDASRIGASLLPSSLARGAFRLLPFAVVPLVAGSILFVQVWNGFQGKAAEKKAKDYWRRNIATWKDAPLPDMARVDIDVRFDPPKRAFHMKGSYRLVNREAKAIAKIPLTGSLDWKKIHWTVNGDTAAVEDRLKLFVVTPPVPLAPGDSLTIGFEYDGVSPRGVTKNGGGPVDTFVLPAGIVERSFESGWVPMLGWQESIGVDRDNRYDSKEYPDDFYEGITPSEFGGSAPYPTRIRVSGPPEYRYNSNGVLESDEVAGGVRTMTWVSDHPVNFFNVVAGKWSEKRGNGTVLYYHPSHSYNVDEMVEAMDGARRWYSEWFYPFPWKELKISEFPGLAAYAQGFPTNITFSEQIGFLTKSDPKANLAFMVTSHETAHQWWGNILAPGKGPGGDILSEGMAHFSTILLFQQVKGEQQRIEFCKRIESRYGDRRRVDSERPLVKIDGTKEGDTTVTYDKGGWVFWMLMNLMGRENALAGCREFIHHYAVNRDHPVLQDFTATMRGFAPDTTAYDAFVDQWFHHVVVPEYRLSGAKKSASGDRWTVTVSVKNAGAGVMPVEISAERGVRFPEEKGMGKNRGDAKPGTASAAEPDPKKAWHDARTTVVLGAGEEKSVTIDCPFDPERVLVDPDVMVLQLNRKNALAKL